MKRFLRKRWKLQHNAFLWVGVQGVVALSLLFAPIFLRRTHVILEFLKDTFLFFFTTQSYKIPSLLR
ncbi:hypothetical protein [Leptospira noguchii]|uniref:hypothetical protein n=1 Tax=Leptospira noguchii TaxID=28182 RepID=UPI0012F62D3D|nr:hypothetical protein [Leptospira noguchii]